MTSGLYPCEVLHQRISPRRHRFRYGLFYFWLNLNELSELNRTLWPWVGVERPALYSFREQDHLTDYCPGDLKTRIAQVMSDQSVNWDPHTGQVWLMTHLRVLGYVFNPVSFFCCADEMGQPVAIIVQVGNTFNELKPYVLTPTPGHRPSRKFPDSVGFCRRVVKQFYVSPFSEVSDWFDFRLHWPDADGFFYSIANLPDDHQPPSVLTWLNAQSRQPLTVANLLGQSVKHPMVTAGVIVRIHWQALRLWLKRVPFFSKQAKLDQQTDRLRPVEHG